MKTMWQSIPGASFRQGSFDGNSTVAEAKRFGGFGVGEFEALSAEMVALNGEYYRCSADGYVARAEDNGALCYTSITEFASPTSIGLAEFADLTALGGILDPHTMNSSGCCAIHVAGTFSQVAVGIFRRQQKPYPTFAAAMADRVTLHRRDVNGHLIGFHCAEFFGEIGVAGYHFHFISDDREFGGHVLAVSEGRAEINFEVLDRFSLNLPRTTK